MLNQFGTLQISRSRFRHNLQLLRDHLPPDTQLCATIKANAYGHGLEPIATLLHLAKINWLCVYSFPEAVTLPAHFNILILAPFVATGPLSPPPPFPIPPHLRLNLTDPDSARHLSQLLVRDHALAKIHIQIDAGLTRAGVAIADALPLANLVQSLPNLQLEGLFAHLSHGDVPGHRTTTQQLQTLQAIAAPLRKKIPNLLVHIQNSAGSIHFTPQQAASFNMARLGIALYGLQPSMAHPIPNLQPIARLTAPILSIHHRPPNTGVGYSHTFTTNRPSRLAILPLGYADGYPRALSNHPQALAQLAAYPQQNLPIVGRVSMDQIILDLTDAPSHAQAGDQVIVFSQDPTRPNCIDNLAHSLDTIGYELATRLGDRLQRTIVD